MVTRSSTAPTPRTVRTGVFAALAAAALLIGSCSSDGEATATEEDSTAQSNASSLDDTLADFGLTGLDSRESIELLDALPVAERPASSELMATIHADQLVYSNVSGEEASLPLDDDEFYLAVAPYNEQTHSCYFHSLTTCIGEMGNTPVHVVFTDADTGEVLIDDEFTTYDNGFVGFWLPADITGELTVTADGLTATEEVATGPDDLTCLTTMQLA